MIIEKVYEKVKAQFEADTTGHDWHHIQRVVDVALYIQEREGGDREIVELAALLHDISDHKLNGGKLNHGGNVATEILNELGFPSHKTELIASIVDGVSYKGAGVADKMDSIEGKIVQDADRLDAIGAIGIARAFAYGGHKNRPLYMPESEPEMHNSFEIYANSKSHTINHFYEKLLLLKDRLHTNTAKSIGQQRHDFMVQYLEQFYNEWNTKIEQTHE
jgi:uncharacterized protein